MSPRAAGSDPRVGLAPKGLFLVSGGQTGVDRAALEFARRHGLPHGGWCPRGRQAEDGVIDPRYGLWESRSADCAERTRLNVELADGVLLLSQGHELAGGSRLALEEARRSATPCLHATPETDADILPGWLVEHRILTLNVAGPRASEEPEVASFATDWLERGFERGLARCSESPAPDGSPRTVFFWLIPRRSERTLLQARIDRLSARDAALAFVPHATLAVLSIEEERVGERLSELAALAPEARFELAGLGASRDEPRRTFTLELAGGEELRSACARIGLSTEAGIDRPHLSLSYTRADKTAGRELLAELPETLVFDELWAVGTGEGLEAAAGRPLPEEWRLLFCRPLRGGGER